MKKKIIILFLGLFMISGMPVLTNAQLNKDVQYIRALVVSINEAKHELTVKDLQTNSLKTFDISLARYSPLAKDQEVFVIVPVGSNKAKSIRHVVKRR